MRIATACFATSFVRRREAVLADLAAALSARGIRPIAAAGAQPLVLAELRRVRTGVRAPQPAAVPLSA